MSMVFLGFGFKEAPAYRVQGAQHAEDLFGKVHSKKASYRQPTCGPPV